jgi:hypothetical protein
LHKPLLFGRLARALTKNTFSIFPNRISS